MHHYKQVKRQPKIQAHKIKYAHHGQFLCILAQPLSFSILHSFISTFLPPELYIKTVSLNMTSWYGRRVKNTKHVIFYVTSMCFPKSVSSLGMRKKQAHVRMHTGLGIHSLKERRQQALCKHEIVLPSLGNTTTSNTNVSCLHLPTCTSPKVATGNMDHSWNSHPSLVWYKPYLLFLFPQL